MDDMSSFRISGALDLTHARSKAFIGYSINWYLNKGMTPLNPCNFTSFEVIVRDKGGGVAGDGSRWTFSRDTVQPDITAYELARALSITLTLPDGMMDQFKQEPDVLRHFQRIAGEGFVATD